MGFIYDVIVNISLNDPTSPTSREVTARKYRIKDLDLPNPVSRGDFVFIKDEEIEIDRIYHSQESSILVSRRFFHQVQSRKGEFKRFEKNLLEEGAEIECQTEWASREIARLP